MRLMKFLVRRAVGLVELLFGLGMLILVIVHIINYGKDMQLRVLPGAIISLGFIYYGKKFLFNEIDLFDDKIIFLNDIGYLQAVETARKNLGYFILKLKEGDNEYYIKFLITGSNNKMYQVWGMVHNHQGNFFNVTVMTPVNKKNPSKLKRVMVLENEVLDWKIEDSKENIYGAYTLLAAAKKAQEIGYRLNRKSKKEIGKIIPINV